MRRDPVFIAQCPQSAVIFHTADDHSHFIRLHRLPAQQFLDVTQHRPHLFLTVFRLVASAIILLVTPQYLLITVQINEFAEKGAYGIACAFATILIAITYSAVLLMNLVIKYFGTSKMYKEE